MASISVAGIAGETYSLSIHCGIGGRYMELVNWDTNTNVTIEPCPEGYGACLTIS
jgi:hypothetical protein